MDYEHYRMTILEWARYLGESVFICVVINALCYQSIAAFLFLLPIPFWYIRQKQRMLLRRRKQRLYHQFRDALNSLNAAVSAGYSLENAVAEAGKDLNRIYGADQEMPREFAYMTAQMQMSIPVEKLFYELGVRSQVEDIRNFSEILSQSKCVGGNMREMIQKCVHIMEDKIDVKKEIDAMAASRKLEHSIMSLMPVVIILYMHFTSPGFLDVLYHNIVGIFIMTVSLVLYWAAFLWGRRIVDIEV